MAEATARPPAMAPARLRVIKPVLADASASPMTASNMVLYIPAPGTRGIMAEIIKRVAGRLRITDAISVYSPTMMLAAK